MAITRMAITLMAITRNVSGLQELRIEGYAIQLYATHGPSNVLFEFFRSMRGHLKTVVLSDMATHLVYDICKAGNQRNQKTSMIPNAGSS